MRTLEKSAIRLSFAPPSIGSVCSIGAGDAISMDLNKKQQHFYYADALNNVGGEMTYPGCVAIGTVPGNPGGMPVGAAVDAPESL